MICVREKKGGDEERERCCSHVSCFISRPSDGRNEGGARGGEKHQPSITLLSPFAANWKRKHSRSDQASVRKWVAQERDAIKVGLFSFILVNKKPLGKRYFLCTY